MNSHQVFAYQPIVDVNLTPVAVELVCYGSTDTAESAQKVANVVLDAFVHAGPTQLPRQRLTYLEVSPALLASGLTAELPAELLALVVRSDEVAALSLRCRELKQEGYRLALDGIGRGPDFNLDPLRAYLPYFDVVRFDGKEALLLPLPVFAALHACGLQLLAHRVDSESMLTELRDKGFTLFQGYHFARPAPLLVSRLDPRKAVVLDMLAKLSSDADDPVIEEGFKSNPELSLQLLRIVNSSAFMLKTKIRSIKHAFAILGRKQLERWLQVLLFALDGDGGPSPLMELALRRARFMEFVLIYRTHQGSTVLQDQAYMTGLLSLVNVLMGWSIQEIVDRLSLTDEISQALLHREGTLGRLLDLCEMLEAANFDAALSIAEALHLPLEAVMTAQHVALSYSEHVGRENASPTDETPAE